MSFQGDLRWNNDHINFRDARSRWVCASIAFNLAQLFWPSLLMMQRRRSWIAWFNGARWDPMHAIAYTCLMDDAWSRRTWKNIEK